MDNFEKELIAQKRKLAKRMIAYIEFLEANNIQDKDYEQAIKHVFMCKEICAKNRAK